MTTPLAPPANGSQPQASPFGRMKHLTRFLGNEWRGKLRRILPPIISSFLCFVFVVVRPLSRLGGEIAFLCYTTLLLFCFPAGTIGGQIEATGKSPHQILGITFTAAGLAWSIATLAIAAYCGRTYGPDSAEARTVIGIGLASLAFLVGFIRSYAPRLTLASRIGLFFPVFLLTEQQAILEVSPNLFLDSFYVALFAAAFGLVPIAIIARKSSGPALGTSMLGTLSAIHHLLPISLSTYLDGDELGDIGHSAQDKPAAGHTPSHVQHALLGRALKASTAQIGPALKAYSNEILHSRLPPTHLQPVVTALKAVARNPLLGSASHTPGERIQAALLRVGKHTSQPSSGIDTPRRGISSSTSRNRGRTAALDGNQLARELEQKLDAVPAYLRAEAGLSGHRADQSAHSRTPDANLAERWNELSRCACAAVRTVSAHLADVWDWADPLARAASPDTKVRQDLVDAIRAFELDLERALDPDEGYSRALSGSRTPVRSTEWRNNLATNGDKDNFRLAFYMVSLRDLGRDALRLLDLVVKGTAEAPAAKTWYIPYLLRWIRSARLVQPADVLGDEDIADGDVSDTTTPNPTGDLDFIQAALRRQHHAELVSRGKVDRVRLLWRSAWDSHKSLQIRIGISRFLHSSRHSRHSVFGFKLTLGISLLSLPALLPPGHAGRVWFEDVRGGWMVASYLYVLEVHTGAIFRVGMFRIVGTFLGAVAAYVCSLIAHDNPYALVTLATICSVPIAYIILFTTFPGVGTVAGITLPPLLFLNYLDLANGHDAFFLAWTRFVNITIGIIAAILVGLLVWPDHARVRYFSAVSITLERLTEYYLQLSRDNLRSTLVYQTDRKIYSTLDTSVRREVTAARTLVAVQRNEISLLPRPTRLYAEVLEAAERAIDTLVEIRLLRFGVPRKETVLDVLPLRSELVSAILINLWACSQAFRSRSPLPQFLPNARTALEELMLTVDEQKREGRRRSRGSQAHVSEGRGERVRGREQMAMLYAMAEHEALGELCSLIEEVSNCKKGADGSLLRPLGHFLGVKLT